MSFTLKLQPPFSISSLSQMLGTRQCRFSLGGSRDLDWLDEDVFHTLTLICHYECCHFMEIHGSVVVYCSYIAQMIEGNYQPTCWYGINLSVHSKHARHREAKGDQVVP